MKRLNGEEIKKTCLDVLIDFDKICRNSGLKYSLAYGTLIGAIRHKGFIPWDDDIDVIMPREDYEKLIAMKIEGRYQIFSYKNTEDYYYPFAKMVDTYTTLHEKTRIEKELGIYIDIFPIDNYDIKRFDEIYTNNLVYLNREWNYAGRSKSNKFKVLLKDIRHGIVKLVSPNYIKDLLYKHDEYLKTLHNTDARCSGSFTVREYAKRELFDFDLFTDGVIECEFEKHSFLVIKSYDAFLSHIYGDYMKLPPEEKRVARHEMEAWLK